MIGKLCTPGKAFQELLSKEIIINTAGGVVTQNMNSSGTPASSTT
ncbi:unnamed protein product [Rhodiola kirilowii]